MPGLCSTHPHTRVQRAWVSFLGGINSTIRQRDRWTEDKRELSLSVSGAVAEEVKWMSVSCISSFPDVVVRSRVLCSLWWINSWVWLPLLSAGYRVTDVTRRQKAVTTDVTRCYSRSACCWWRGQWRQQSRWSQSIVSSFVTCHPLFHHTGVLFDVFNLYLTQSTKPSLHSHERNKQSIITWSRKLVVYFSVRAHLPRCWRKLLMYSIREGLFI